LPAQDGAAIAVDLASPPAGDLGFATGGGDMCLAACPISCPAGAWCIFIDRGDCATWGCTLREGNCQGKTTCACAGGDKVCGFFANAGETLTCVDRDPPGWCGQADMPDFVCQSTTLCI
jgi:hypothetical protein